MKSVTVKHNQRLIDIALQELGDTERVFELAQLNGISITDELQPGTVLQVPTADNSKTGIVRVLTQGGKAPASADNETEDPILPPGGIGFMQLENNFIVS